MHNDWKDKVRDIKKQFRLRFNQELTEALCSKISFPCWLFFRLNDRMMFTKKGLSNEILSMDHQFNKLSLHTLSFLPPCQITAVVPYKDELIVLAPFQDIKVCCTKQFEFIASLEDRFCELRNKHITAALADDKGNIYFAESQTGNLYVYDVSGNLSVYKTDFRLVYSMQSFNNILYLIDLFPVNYNIYRSNILAFEDNQFKDTGMIGEDLTYYPEYDCFFTVNHILKKTIMKCDSSGTILFEKIYPDGKMDISPHLCKIIGNHLIIGNASTWQPIVFDI